MRYLTVIMTLLLIITPVSCKKTTPAGKKTQPDKIVKPQVEETKPETQEEIVAFNPPERDPFSSLVLKAKQAEKVKKKGLSPLESYSVDEFKLIAIVWDRHDKYAMVTVPDGKSYTLKEGMKVGIHDGKVLRIEPGSVHIREYIKDYKGNIKSRDYIMKLREEE